MMVKEMLLEDLKKRNITLTERELEVLTLRFGLDRGDQPRSLEEVGQMLGITRQEIIQIERKAIYKKRGVHKDVPVSYFWKNEA